MTELQYVITKALPRVDCPVDMANVAIKRIWLEREIILLAKQGKIIENDNTAKT